MPTSTRDSAFSEDGGVRPGEPRPFHRVKRLGPGYRNGLPPVMNHSRQGTQHRIFPGLLYSPKRNPLFRSSSSARICDPPEIRDPRKSCARPIGSRSPSALRTGTGSSTSRRTGRPTSRPRATPARHSTTPSGSELQPARHLHSIGDTLVPSRSDFQVENGARRRLCQQTMCF